MERYRVIVIDHRTNEIERLKESYSLESVKEMLLIGVQELQAEGLNKFDEDVLEKVTEESIRCSEELRGGRIPHYDVEIDYLRMCILEDEVVPIISYMLISEGGRLDDICEILWW